MKLDGVVVAVLVVIAMVIGFLAGRATGPSGDGEGAGVGNGQASGPVGSKSDRSANNGWGPGGRREGTSGRSPAATIRQVARELEVNPMASMDFDAMFQAYEAIRWMSPGEIQKALAELESMGTNPQIKMVMTMMLINQWAKQDGQGAVEFAMQSDQGMMKTMGIMGGIMGWVKQDPEAAYAWYQDNQEKLSKGGMMAGQIDGMILAALAQRDLPRAFEGLSTLKKQQQEMALMVMGQQMTMDPVKREQFVKQLESLDDASLRQKGLEGMVSMWAFQDPQGAAEFIGSREWEGETEQQLRTSLAASWGNLDPEAALSWRLENLDETEDASAVVATGFSQWMTQDPEEAQKWLKTQPPEVLSDQLYAQTATQLQFRNEFVEAVEWAGRMEGQAAREETMRQVHRTWSAQEPEAAQEWLEQLDPALQESLKGAAPANGVEVFPTNDGAVPTVPVPEGSPE